MCDKKIENHTPGIWKDEWLDSLNGWIIGKNKEGEEIYLATIVAEDEESKLAPPMEQRANARLMAAAPQLLAVLNDLSQLVEHSSFSNSPQNKAAERLIAMLKH